ncbi:hypothetical protein GUITHDRAFT_106434 [Guillardia theta CCMP2712]|uniref:Mitochondrial GTPase 1 n=2 Tax=Guillardia theta TaxID=55529 RepID=L1JHB9_GUITC|nr:hypothetical protein GUITHDRAFT_106434 [Guillardia theta CCMP2712]EKX47886.1 hypothetical protein GUITHDRAFT_106434 [Guillardia theta CCMP2712]|eukprot:XP_005834866.1 hypothetical protein GUITHDRAFT_106434 [Guillardia theta CCMP2712]
MAEAVRKIEQRIKVSDMVIEVRDARIPLTSECARIQELLARKRRVIVLNKQDLILPSEREKWRKFFTDKGDTVTFTQAVHGANIKELMPSELHARGLISRLDRTLLCMIVGIPNTGKSTLINTLRNFGYKDGKQKSPGKVANTGALPGVTKHVSTIQFHVKPPSFLVDTPGIVKMDLDVIDGLKLALTGAIKDSLIDPLILAEFLIHMLSMRQSTNYLTELSLPTDCTDLGEILTAVAKFLIANYRSGKLCKYTLDNTVPESI